MIRSNEAIQWDGRCFGPKQCFLMVPGNGSGTWSVSSQYHRRFLKGTLCNRSREQFRTQDWRFGTYQLGSLEFLRPMAWSGSTVLRFPPKKLPPTFKVQNVSDQKPEKNAAPQQGWCDVQETRRRLSCSKRSWPSHPKEKSLPSFDFFLVQAQSTAGNK